MKTICLDNFLFPKSFDWKSAEELIGGKTGVIYCIRNDSENKYYIGETINFETRIKQHVTQNSHCKYLMKDIEKLGANKFSVTILEEIQIDSDIKITKIELRKKEKLWQEFLRKNNYFLYNDIWPIKREEKRRKKAEEERKRREKYNKSIKEIPEILSDDDRKTVKMLLEEGNKHHDLYIQHSFYMAKSKVDYVKENYRKKAEFSKDRKEWCNTRLKEIARSYGWNGRD